ncbi:hypothetical protein KY092_11355 [Natronomonas gomsonensis]|uniref:hypothetical protein n=1 Tax=Natronomonas gomsonensis TaxID=1046043 RepID=UPI0020CA9432|nr:hypothetical protein [Natronomonas gomsonensis]MCY4731151.1 hypothetical protein [Natronomonas gomsonensis]
MADEESIRARLSDSRITIHHIGEDEDGSFAWIEVEGTPDLVRQLTADSFEIEDGVIETADSPPEAVVRPKF